MFHSLPVWAKLTISGAVVAGTAAGGLAVAGATTSLPPGTIHGCVYTHSNRTLERVYTYSKNGTTCPTGSFMVVWNKRGPAGPAGVTNLQADEPYGQNVDPNANVTQSDSTVPAGQTAVVWAACPPGKTAISGGFRIGDGALSAESDSTGPGYTSNDEQVLASEPSYYDFSSGTLKLSLAPPVTSYGSYLPNAWAVTVHNSGTADAAARVALVCADVTD